MFYAFYYIYRVSRSDLKYIKSNVGRVYQFNFIKQISIGKKNHFLIEDNDQNRFILPAKPYLNYGFKMGQPINCRLDRINCKGEVFFEPLHSFYSPGQLYEFTYKCKVQIEHILGFTETVHIVSDKFGAEHYVRYSNAISEFKPSELFYVWTIRKGKMLLIPYLDGNPIFKLNETYRFLIEREIETDRLGAGFLLRDNYGNNHVIARNRYENYVLKVGNKIQCKIVGSSSKGYFYLEPLHPVYEIGKTYNFEVFNFIKTAKSVHFFVLDYFGEIIKVELKTETLISNIPKTLVCRVIGLHKGKPELDFVF